MESEFSFRQMMQRYQPLSSMAGSGEGITIEPDLIAILVKVFEDNRAFDVNAFDKFSLEMILDYVRRTHSYYVFRKLPEIEQSITILLKDYSAGHPLLPILHRFYADYQKNLTGHIRGEERELLPYIEYLLGTSKGQMDVTEHFIRTKDYSLQQFIEHHHDTEMNIVEVEAAIKQYTPPSTSETPYRILVSQLEMLQKDLAVHALVEDRVLIPRALQLEEKLDARMRVAVKKN